MEKICYEIVGGYAQGLKNCLFFEGEEDEQTKATLAGSILPLDIISLRQTSNKSDQYIEVLQYFIHQDRIYLEKERLGYEEGEICSKCKKGYLRPSGQKETTRRDTPKKAVKTTNVTSKVFLCDYCGSRFDSTYINMR
jgi:hypothetical protein